MNSTYMYKYIIFINYIYIHTYIMNLPTVCFRSFIDKMYKIAFQVNLTDWMDRPDLLPMGQNVDWLARGLLETPGREYQASYNPLVRILFIRFLLLFALTPISVMRTNCLFLDFKLPLPF